MAPGRSQFGGSSSSQFGGSQASKARMVEHFRDQERQIESLIQSNQLMARKVSGHRARAAAAVAEVAALQTLNAELLQRAMDLPRPQSRPVGSTIKGTSRPGSRASNRMGGESSGGLEKRPLTATHSLRAHIKDLEEQARLRGILPPPAPKIEENAFPSRPPSRMHPRHARNTVVPRERVFRADENQFRQVEDAFWLLHARERMLRADTEAACLRLLEKSSLEEKFTQGQATPAAKIFPLGEGENQNSTAPPERVVHRTHDQHQVQARQGEERPAEPDPVPPAGDHEAEVEERSVASDVGDEAAPPAAAAQSGEQFSTTMEVPPKETSSAGGGLEAEDETAPAPSVVDTAIDEVDLPAPQTPDARA